MHRLPGDAGERHLADEMQKDDLTALAHGNPADRRRPRITAERRQNFRRHIAAPRAAGAKGRGLAPAATRMVGRPRLFLSAAAPERYHMMGAHDADEPEEKNATS